MPQLSQTEIHKACHFHLEIKGADPLADSEQTAEQADALKAKVTRGEPYADFSVKQMKARSWVLQQDATSKGPDIPGHSRLGQQAGLQAALFMLRYEAATSASSGQCYHPSCARSIEGVHRRVSIRIVQAHHQASYGVKHGISFCKQGTNVGTLPAPVDQGHYRRKATDESGIRCPRFMDRRVHDLARDSSQEGGAINVSDAAECSGSGCQPSRPSPSQIPGGERMKKSETSSYSFD